MNFKERNKPAPRRNQEVMGYFVLFLVLIGTCLILTACGKKEKALFNNTLLIGISRDWRVGDPWSHKAFNCLIFETLITRDKNGKLIPLLAESWEKNSGGKHYTFHIRKGITFSDGTSLTAQLVKEAFGHREKRKLGNRRDSAEKQNDEFPRYPRRSMIKSIDVLNEYTIRFNLEKPYVLFLNELAATHMRPILKPSPDEKIIDFIGTGPYRIIAHKRTQYYTLMKNDSYWQGNVNIKKIIFRVIPDSQTRSIALEAGDIDITGIDPFSKIPMETVPGLKKIPKICLKRLFRDEPSVGYLVLNYRKEPFINSNVRKAIRLSIDRKKIDGVIGEVAGSINGPIPETHYLYNTNIKYIDRDIDKARALLTGAGWNDTNGDGILDRNGNKFTVRLSFDYFNPLYKIIGEIIQAQLRDVGITVKLRLLESGAHQDSLRNQEFEMAFWPQMGYHMFYYSKTSYWLNMYQNDELDEAFTEYLFTNDFEKSRRAMHRTQQIIVENAVMPFFFQNFDVVAWNNERLKNFEPLPLGWNLCMNLWRAALMETQNDL